jgi:DNA polymerase III delta prime subunit
MPPEIEAKYEELRIRREDNKARDAREMAKLALQKEIKILELAQQYNLKVEDLRAMLQKEAMKSKDMRDMTALRETNKITELNMKRATGSGV